MTKNHAAAIFRWREQVDQISGGLATFNQSATISTMLFGCNTWLRNHADSASEAEIERIETIKAELEAWLAQRGLAFTQ